MVVLCASLNNGCLQKMSSHHFVKEDQEPALIIADASAVSFEKIQELLEWSPTVIVMESSLEMVLSWGIKMDVAIVKTESITRWTSILNDQMPVKLLTYSKEDALLTAFHFILAKKQYTANLVSDLNQPLSVFLASINNRLSVVVFSKQIRWSFLSSGKFEKWLPEKSSIKIFNPDEENKIIQTQQEGIFTIKRPAPFWIGTEW